MKITVGIFVFGFLLALSSPILAADVPATYTKNCIVCHGADGHGKAAASLKGEIPDLHSKQVQEMSDDEIYDTIARGTGHKNYPHAFLYRGLSPKDIHELVKYIRTFSPATK